MEVSRRSFLSFLSAAPFVFDPRRKIFDMGRSKIWTPPPPEIIPAELGSWIELGPAIDFSINAVLKQYGQEITEQAIVIAEAINGNSQQELLRKIDRIASR
jgi:hypothetical protein